MSNFLEFSPSFTRSVDNLAVNAELIARGTLDGIIAAYPRLDWGGKLR